MTTVDTKLYKLYLWHLYTLIIRLVLNYISFNNKIDLNKLDNNYAIMPTINQQIIVLICLLSQPNTGTVLLLNLCCFAYS